MNKMDNNNMDNNNDMNASTSHTGTEESVVESLQVVKDAIEAHNKYQQPLTYKNKEAAINAFDLQRSNDFVMGLLHKAETLDELLHRPEPPPEVLKNIAKGVVNKLIKHIHGENEGKNEASKNEASIRTNPGKVAFALSKASEDDLPGISADLSANLMSEKENIDASKSRIKELVQKRTHLTERHNENVNEYSAKAEKYRGLEVKFQQETDEMNEENRLHYLELEVERTKHEAEVDKLKRELAKVIEEYNNKIAQKGQEFKCKEAEVHKDINDANRSLSFRQGAENRHAEKELIGAEREVKESQRCLVDNTIAIDDNMHDIYKFANSYNDLIAKSHALTIMNAGALDQKDSHLLVAEMSAKEILGLIPTNDLLLINSMSVKKCGKYLTSLKNLGLHKNKEFYAPGEANELVSRKEREKLDQMKIRALKATTVTGKIDSLPENVLQVYRPMMQLEQLKKKRARKDDEISGSPFPLCVPSPLNKTNILKISSLTFDGSTPNAKKRRRLSPPGSLNRASHGLVLSQNQVFTPDRPLYQNLFTSASGPSLSQSSFGDVSVSNLKDPENYE
jgi:hypothetical protein